ncbi:PspC domain-containing protein [Calidifontibacillus erzurumensis]|uniref:PspC domain-containing protein n=1 Tax=Calidifontibacillus erzurumensis TaxID=2741433 RepID=A0A8J8GFP3_9BACI|nr:PspC domain-containing protein [Calidifontibacillus erzurumensis]NSL53085.1 PspC domain-containing protein [Calidifontibacillus erzurumensis]
MLQKLTKSSSDKVFLGICGGMANLLGISSFIVRLIFLFTFSVSIWVYVLLAWELKNKPPLL